MFFLKKIMLISILSLVSINIFAEFKDNKVTEEYFGGIWKYDSQKSIILLSSPNEGLVISHDKANIEKDYAIKIFRWFKKLAKRHYQWL